MMKGFREHLSAIAPWVTSVLIQVTLVTESLDSASSGHRPFRLLGKSEMDLTCSSVVKHLYGSTSSEGHKKEPFKDSRRGNSSCSHTAADGTWRVQGCGLTVSEKWLTQDYRTCSYESKTVALWFLNDFITIVIVVITWFLETKSHHITLAGVELARESRLVLTPLLSDGWD